MACSACGLKRRPQRKIAIRSSAPDSMAANEMVRIVAIEYRRPFLVRRSGIACKASNRVGAAMSWSPHIRRP